MLQSLPLPSRIKENISIEWRDLWKLWFLIILIQHLPRISGWKDKHFRWRIIHFLPPRLCYYLYDLIIFIVSIIRLIIITHCVSCLFNTAWFYIHVASDWADIFDRHTKQEKTYLKPRCTPFPENMSFNPETVAKCWATVWAWVCPRITRGQENHVTKRDHD